MSLRKKTIDYFELYVDDDVLQLGESSYLQDKVVLSHDSSTKGYYTGEVDGYQVQLKLHDSLIQDISCSCMTFDARGFCEHSVATLFKIRDLHNNASPSSSVENSRFTVSKVLNEISHDQLKQFSRAYNSKDKKFGLLLKIHFARDILGDASIAAYKSVADTLLRPVKLKDGKFSGAAIRLLVSVAKEFFDQFDDALSLQQFAQSFNMLFAIFPKIAYAKFHLSSPNSTVNAVNKRAHDSLALLLQMDLAPALKRQICFECFDLMNRSYYRFDDFSSNIAILLWRSELASPVLQTLQDLIVKLRAKVEVGSRDHLFLSAFCALLFEDEKLDKWLYEYSDVRPVLQIAKMLDEWGESERSADVLEYYDGQNMSPPQAYALQRSQYQLYDKLNRKQDQIAVGFRMAIYKRDVDLLQELTLLCDDPTQMESFIADVKDEKVQRQFWLKYLQATNSYDRLFDTLVKDGNLSELKQYDRVLYEYFPEGILTLYQDLLTKKLQDQLGDGSLEIMEDTIYHLKRRQLHALAQAVKEYVMDRYEYRSSFVDELAKI